RRSARWEGWPWPASGVREVVLRQIARRAQAQRPGWLERGVFSFLTLETFVNGFDEFVGGPEAGGGTIQRIVILGRTGRLHLFQRHALLDHVLNAIANDDGHFAEIQYVAEIAQAAMARDNHGASFLAINRDD